MSTLKLSRALVALAVPVAVAGTIASAPSPERTPISGVFTLQVSQEHALPVADAAGPVLVLSQATGTNRNTGKFDHMDGARVINRGIADLIQGTGPHQGYVTEIKGADTTLTRWSGKVTTTLGPDRKPATTFEGTWSKVSGTGKYKGVAGDGTYAGRMTSPTEYTVEWKGELILQRTASR